MVSVTYDRMACYLGVEVLSRGLRARTSRKISRTTVIDMEMTVVPTAKVFLAGAVSVS